MPADGEARAALPASSLGAGSREGRPGEAGFGEASNDRGRRRWVKKGKISKLARKEVFSRSRQELLDISKAIFLCRNLER